MIGNVAVRVDDDEDAELADEPAHYVGTDIRLELSPDPLPISVLVPIDATPQVAIYSNTSLNEPLVEICQLERLTGYETDLRLPTGDWPDEMYAGSCAGETLAANTRYWIVFRSLELYPDSHYRVGHANSDDEDASGAPGWSIGDTTWVSVYNEGEDTKWGPLADSDPLAIGVYASPK